MKSNPPFDFHEKVIFRSPLYPLTNVVNDKEVFRFFFKKETKEALFLASPNLYRKLNDYQRNPQSFSDAAYQKLIFSLSKYYQRFHFRCTPFGLFAGVGTVDWGNENKIPVLKENCSRKTRLDMYFLGNLTKHFTDISCVRNNISFFPNTTLYSFCDEFRYIESTYKKNNSKVHQIVSVKQEDFLQAIFDYAQKGAKLKDIAALLVDEEVNEEEALDFVNEVVEAQLLVSELDFSVTGEEYFFKMIKVLKGIENKSVDLYAIIDTLEETKARLIKLDEHFSNSKAAYEEIVKVLERFEVLIDRGRLFQVDLSLPSETGTLSTDLQKEILEVTKLLTAMIPKTSNPNLDKFKQEFLKRYEDKEMPLAEVLDAENGIGYSNNGVEDDSALIGDLIVSEKELKKKTIPVGELESWKNKRLIKAHQEGEYEVVISEKDIEQLNLDAPDFDDLPASLSVIFRLVGEENLICFDNIGNASATVLGGRFAQKNTAINQLVTEVAEEEEKQNPNVVFAEIVHLPENRTGNILQRPAIRKHEIPYLAKATVPVEDQICIDDLCVSVYNNRVILRSRNRNIEVQPRLTAAHNYTYNTLPVYQFLCDLQYQGFKSGLAFKWGTNHFSFLPRVRFQNAILYPATWRMKGEEVKPFFPVTISNKERWEQFRGKHKLPSQFCLAQGDNELQVDTEHLLSVNTFLNAVKHLDKFTLKEVLVSGNLVVTNEKNDPFANQFIATLIKNKTSYPNKLPDFLGRAMQCPQKFSFGSEWLYFKIYTGKKTTDSLLINPISNLVKTLKEKGLMDAWFFLRFGDPDHHLRVRFHLPNPGKSAAVAVIVQQFLKPYEDSGLVWKTQVDTYIRELNRYGGNAIVYSEEIFFRDSESSLSFIKLPIEEEEETIRWGFALKSLDQLLDGFKLNLTQKIRIVKMMKDAFAKEFRSDKNLRKALSTKYRSYTGFINAVFEGSHIHSPEIDSILLQRKEKIKNPCATILSILNDPQRKVSLDQVIASNMHMLVNRLLPDNPRKHELVLYEFLFRFYKSYEARHKAKTIGVP